MNSKHFITEASGNFTTTERVLINFVIAQHKKLSSRGLTGSLINFCSLFDREKIFGGNKFLFCFVKLENLLTKFTKFHFDCVAVSAEFGTVTHTQLNYSKQSLVL